MLKVDFSKKSYANPCTPLELFFVSIILILLVLSLYSRTIVHNFWMYDDLHILNFIDVYGLTKPFLDSHTWKFFSSANFTPLLLISFGLDYTFFGFSPFMFYVHQILALSILTILLYRLSRFYIPVWAGLVAAVFFIFSRPFAVSAEILMIRHYIEGAAFSVLSAIFFIAALRRNSYLKATLASACYFAAALCKEVYIPLAFLLLFVPEKSFHRRFRLCLFYTPALIFYFLFRHIVLGSLVGGYSGQLMSPGSASVFNSMVDIIKYLYRAPAGNEFMGSSVAAVLFTLYLLSLTMVGLRKNFISVSLMLSGLIVVIVPLLPIVQYLDPDYFINYRFAFASTVLLSLLLAFSLSTIGKVLENKFTFTGSDIFISKNIFKKTCGGMILFFLILHGLSVQLWHKQQRTDLIKPLSAEGRFLWENPGPGVLVRSTTDLGLHFYENMDYFIRHKKNQRAKKVVARNYGLISNINQDSNGKTTWYRYNFDSDKVIDQSTEIEKKRQKLLSNISYQHFSVQLQSKPGRFELSLHKPDMSGSFVIFMGYLPGIYCDAFITPLMDDPFNLSQSLSNSMDPYMRFGWISEHNTELSLSPQWQLNMSQYEAYNWP